MKIIHLTLKEILFRKEGFILGVLSVAVSVGILVAEFTLLDLHVFRNEQLLRRKEQETKGQMKRLQDDYRKITKAMGYNLFLISKNQDLAEFYATGSITHSIPEDYAEKLAQAKLESVKHIQPCLELETRWREKENRPVIVSGVGEENPLSYETGQQPILIPPETGKIVIGCEIAKNQDLKTGDQITLLGEMFQIKKVHPPRGTRDDITVWTDLKKAQKILKQEDRINAIRALKCHCHGNDREIISRQIRSILPDIQMIEFSEMAATRGQVRDRAKDLSGAAIEAEQQIRAGLRMEREDFIAWLIPLVIIGCTTWIGLLFFSNVRERRREIAILTALGFRSGHIVAVFVFKALFIGLAGSFLGYASGFIVGILYGIHDAPLTAGIHLFDAKMMAAFVIAACVLSALASLVPALSAAGQEPAEIFSRE